MPNIKEIRNWIKCVNIMNPQVLDRDKFIDNALKNIPLLLTEVDRLTAENARLIASQDRIIRPIEITGEGVEAFVQALELSESAQKIQTLEAENARLERERDAAVEDIAAAVNDPCSCCKNRAQKCGRCWPNMGEADGFEWRPQTMKTSR